MIGGPHGGGGGGGGGARRGGRKGGRTAKIKVPAAHKINGLDLLHSRTLLSTNLQGECPGGVTSQRP